MNEKIRTDEKENMNFETISDFKWCMKCGGEVQFNWKGKAYGAFGKILNPENSQIEICVGEGYYLIDGVAYNTTSHDLYVDIKGSFHPTADKALEYVIDGERLRNIITNVEAF